MSEETALAICQPESVLKQSFTALDGSSAELSNEQLADIVIDGVKKLRQYIPLIMELKKRFNDGERNNENRLKVPIKGCHSWDEFCGHHLDRTPQAVNRALAKTKQINHIERRKNRSNPPDSFEQIRELARKMIHVGYQTMREGGESNPSWLYSAKIWSQIRVEDIEVVTPEVVAWFLESQPKTAR